jgi:poly(3-hydroxybutyrate) depolymerase
LSIRHAAPRLSLVFAVLSAAACESASNDFENNPPGTGGTATAGTGGTVSTGGTTGGAVASGGTTGGSGASGGSAGTGVSGSGATGGSVAGSGGSTGGAAAGAGATGGASAGTGTGGSTGGAAGSGTAGAGATGGAAPTSGCNAATFPASGEYSLMVDGIAREYIVAIPEGYASSTPNKLVFAFHGLTGTMEQTANGFGGRNNGYYGLQSRMPNTIFVAPQGLAPEDEPDQFGWPNEGGRDVAFVEAMVAWLSSSYCIDSTRIFSTGMSYGGIMSNTLGCQMPDTFRAIGSIAGAMFGRNGCDGKQVAAWMTHGLADTTITPMQGETARDAFIAKNHCTTATMATTPEGCLAYQGCDAGYPVVWCTHDGGHTIPSYSGEAISAFFSQF